MSREGKYKLQVNELSDSAKSSLKTRVISALIAIVLLIVPVLLGDWAFGGVLIVVLLIAVIEIIRCAKKSYSKWMYAIMFLAVSIIMLYPLVRSLAFSETRELFDGHLFSVFNTMHLSAIVLVISLFLLLYVIMWDGNFTVRDACFIFTIGFLVAFSFQALCYIRFLPATLMDVDPNAGFYNFDNTIRSTLPLFYLLIAVSMTDIGAYFIGMLFGKKKVNPRISPNKTWAGFFGGLGVSFVFSAAFALILAATGNPILPVVKELEVEGVVQTFNFSIFDLNHWYNIIILSAILPCFATLGDFVFSAIKRYFEIKDFGKIMPGHGGVLDRVDSLVFAALIMGFFVYIVFCFSYNVAYNPFI